MSKFNRRETGCSSNVDLFSSFWIKYWGTASSTAGSLGLPHAHLLLVRPLGQQALAASKMSCFGTSKVSLENLGFVPLVAIPMKSSGLEHLSSTCRSTSLSTSHVLMKLNCNFSQPPSVSSQTNQSQRRFFQPFCWWFKSISKKKMYFTASEATAQSAEGHPDWSAQKSFGSQGTANTYSLTLCNLIQDWSKWSMIYSAYALFQHDSLCACGFWMPKASSSTLAMRSGDITQVCKLYHPQISCNSQSELLNPPTVAWFTSGHLPMGRWKWEDWAKKNQTNSKRYKSNKQSSSDSWEPLRPPRGSDGQSVGQRSALPMSCEGIAAMS